MKIALFKSSSPNSTAFGRLLDDLTGKLGYCHVELAFDDVDSNGETLCFSSDAGDGGTRFKRIDLTDTKSWTVLGSYPYDEAIKSYCNGVNHEPYDYEGLIRFYLPNAPADKGKLFCSEVVTMAMQTLAMWQRLIAAHTSPNEIYAMLTKSTG